MASTVYSITFIIFRLFNLIQSITDFLKFIPCIDREQFQLGSLSHYIDSRAIGYHELSAFPEVAPDPTVRNVEVPVEWATAVKTKTKSKPVKKKSFYSESEQSSPEDGWC